jgi:hypothetical protein
LRVGGGPARTLGAGGWVDGRCLEPEAMDLNTSRELVGSTAPRPPTWAAGNCARAGAHGRPRAYPGEGPPAWRPQADNEPRRARPRWAGRIRARAGAHRTRPARRTAGCAGGTRVRATGEISRARLQWRRHAGKGKGPIRPGPATASGRPACRCVGRLPPGRVGLCAGRCGWAGMAGEALGRIGWAPVLHHQGEAGSQRGAGGAPERPRPLA